MNLGTYARRHSRVAIEMADGNPEEHVAAIRGIGPEIDAAVTGCLLEDTALGHGETIACAAGEITRTTVERLPIRPCGTGDLFTGLLAARLAAGVPLAKAAARATAEIHAVLTRTEAAGTEEMRLAGFPFTSPP